MTTPDRWPAPLSGPAWHAWRTAWDHIETKTLAGIPHETIQALRATHRVRQAEEHALQRAASGDVLATRAACQTWNTVVRSVLKAHTEAEALCRAM